MQQSGLQTTTTPTVWLTKGHGMDPAGTLDTLKTRGSHIANVFASMLPAAATRQCGCAPAAARGETNGLHCCPWLCSIQPAGGGLHQLAVPNHIRLLTLPPPNSKAAAAGWAW
jgi:hypothetical protein